MTGGLLVMSGCVCFFVFVWGARVWGAGRRMVVTEQRILNFSWFPVAIRGQIRKFFIFLYLNYQMIFIWQKSAVFRRWQNYAKGITSAGMVYEIVSSVVNLFVFCFEECWIDCFICYTIKLKHPIKILLLLMNQWFISI